MFFCLFCFVWFFFFLLFFRDKICSKENILRANANMHQTNSGKSPKFVFSPTFIHCSPICPNNFGVVFFVKIYFSFWEMSFFVPSLKYANIHPITRVVWPHVTNLLDLSYFWRHNPLFYHLNLIPCHYWSWKRNIYSLVNIFVPHTFSMSKSSTTVFLSWIPFKTCDCDECLSTTPVTQFFL